MPQWAACLTWMKPSFFRQQSEPTPDPDHCRGLRDMFCPLAHCAHIPHSNKVSEEVIFLPLKQTNVLHLLYTIYTNTDRSIISHHQF